MIPPIVTQAASTPASLKPRTLKIEEDGDAWKGTVKPKIRLKGSWLLAAGFKHGDHVHITSPSHGLLELRSTTLVRTEAH